MQFKRLSDVEFENQVNSFYENSSLTFTGMIPEEAQLYVDFFKDFTEVNQNETGYLITGQQMNRHYHLHGSNKYPSDLNLLVIPLSAFKDVGDIAIPRFQIGGRWFDDIVDNNQRRNTSC